MLASEREHLTGAAEAEMKPPIDDLASRRVERDYALASYRRRHCGKLARLSANGSPVRGCTVLDLSDIGARLANELPLQVPDKFTLLLTADGGLRRQCEVVWRSESAVGVRFLQRAMAA